MTRERFPIASAVFLLLCGAGCAPSPDNTPTEVPQVTATPPAVAPSSPKPPSEPPRAQGAASYTFDGFKLGTLYGSAVMSRPPYDQPCDNDPIDGKARRFMVYGAQPCRERSFPENTTVLFYIKYAETPDKYDQAIEAFAWLATGASYFASRSDFPVQTGQPASAAGEALGAPVKTFTVERKARVTVQRHPGDVWSIAESDTLVGFVVGPMPEDPESEQWRGLMQMFERYTKPR
jgi:hypothetical protein